MRTPLTSGIVCAALTPLDGTGAPCIPLLVDHCRWLLSSGCSGIVVLGTTGEANSFTLEERRRILAGLIDGGIQPELLMVGTGCCAVGDTVTLTKHAFAAGCARVLVLPPFYYKGVSDAGVIEAYARVIDGVGDDRLRVYLYRIPQMSGVEIGAPVVDALMARFGPVVAGIKDSAGDVASMEALCRTFADRIDVLVGTERLLLAAVEAGATGCVTATANVTAPLVYELYERRETADAAALQARVTAARSMFEGLPMIAALKRGVSHRTGDRRWIDVRPPLVALSDAQAASLFEQLDNIL